MRRFLIILCSLFSLLGFSLYGFAATYSFKWENTYIDVPLGKSIYDYYLLPQAKFYINDVYKNDAEVIINPNGDWLYYLKDVDTNKPGEYKVWYKASENKYNPGQCNGYKALVTFNVVDKEEPIIKLALEEINIQINSKEIDFAKYVTVVDASDYSLNFDDSNLKYTELGSYIVKVIATDIYGNQATKNLKVNVIDSKGPSYNIKDSNYIVERGKEFLVTNYFEAYDEVDGDVIKNTTINGHIDTNTLGFYEIEIIFKDNSNNETRLKITVEVVDTIIPIIELSTTAINLDYQTKVTTDLLRKYLVSAYDNNIDLTNKVIITYNIENIVGSYDVIYSVIDDDGNKAEAKLIVNLISFEEPKIVVSDIVINKYEEINLLEYISIIDLSDPNVLDTLEVNYNNFDNSNEGIYYITVTVHNSSGFYASKSVKIEVISNKSNIYIYGIISIAIILIGSGIIIYYISQKKKNKAIEDTFI